MNGISLTAAVFGRLGLASQIRAAMGVGNWVYAKAIATEVVRRSSDWEHVPLGGFDYTILSYGSLLWAFDQVKGFNSVIPKYTQAILAAQGTDGSWEKLGNYQTTAYEISDWRPSTEKRPECYKIGRHFPGQQPG